MAPKKTKDGQVKAAGKVWLEIDGVKFFGPGPMELLERIDETGSLHIAAKEMGISYRKAWMIVDRMNKVMGESVVLTQKGGDKGGGSTLTKQARELMRKYRKLAKGFEGFLERGSK